MFNEKTRIANVQLEEGKTLKNSHKNETFRIFFLGSAVIYRIHRCVKFNRNRYQIRYIEPVENFLKEFLAFQFL